MSHDGQYQEDIQGNAVGSNGGREFALPEIRNTAQNVTDTSAFADGQQNCKFERVSLTDSVYSIDTERSDQAE